MPKEPRRNYCQSSVDRAVKEVQSGTSIRKASAMYGVPASTIFGHAKNPSSLQPTMGPTTILTAAEEKHLVEWIFHVSEKGFPVTKEQLLDSVKLLVTEMKRETPFTNDRPGRHWYEAFCRRHPELTQRVAQNLTYSRASATEDKLRGWFQEVSDYLQSKDLLNIDPSRVYNCDESGFLLCPKAGNVIVRKGAKAVYNIVNADEKENLTTLFMVNAAGVVVPPMVMFWYKRIPAAVARNVPPEWSIGTSEKGWMTAETFFEYITNVFHPWLLKNNVEFPVVLFVDGHSSHCTLPLSNFCREAKIELIALYPNATHILQPLDVAVFHPLKNAWKKTVNAWRLENDGMRLKKEEFAPLLKNAMESLDLTQTIKNGFRSCGLSPFSADAVDFNILRKGMPEDEGHSREASTSSQVESKFAEHLELMERHLPSEVVRAFEESNRLGIWIGEISNEGLYQYWRKMKGLAANNDNGAVQSGVLGDNHDVTRVDDSLNIAVRLQTEFVFETDTTLQEPGTIILTLDGDDPIAVMMSVEDARNSAIEENIGETSCTFDESAESIDEWLARTTETSERNSTEESERKIEDNAGEIVEGIANVIDECLETTEGEPSDKTTENPTEFDRMSENAEEFCGKSVPENIADEISVPSRVENGVENTCSNISKKATASGRNTMKIASKAAIGGIPSPFKKALFWPDEKKKISNKKKPEKIPSVATSDQWQQFTRQKDEEKQKILQAKEERRKQREKAQEQKKEIELQKKKLREEQKKLQEEMKKIQQEERKKGQQASNARKLRIKKNTQ